MNRLRNICGLRRIDRAPNVEIRRRCGKNVSVGQRIDQGLLRWFGHVERMGDERLAKRVYDSNVRGVRRRGRPRKCWINGVKETLERKGLTIEEAKVSVQDRSEWRIICRGFDELLVSFQNDTRKQRYYNTKIYRPSKSSYLATRANLADGIIITQQYVIIHVTDVNQLRQSLADL